MTTTPIPSPLSQVLGAMLSSKFCQSSPNLVNKEIKENPHWTCFRSAIIPSFDLISFLDGIRIRTPGKPGLTNLTLILTVRMIGMFSQNFPEFSIDGFTIHRLIVAFYTIINKLLNDFIVSDADWTLLFRFKKGELLNLQCSIFYWIKWFPTMNPVLQNWVVSPILRLTNEVNDLVWRKIPITVNYVGFFDLHFTRSTDEITQQYSKSSLQFIYVLPPILPVLSTKSPFPAFSEQEIAAAAKS